VRCPVPMEEGDCGPARPAPRLGQDTRDLLQQVGYAQDAIQALVNAGTIVV
jgi:crotonobetainyl-CoA:carnitine CoA-transferase CaiB-like acyl-CoA transferase